MTPQPHSGDAAELLPCPFCDSPGMLEQNPDCAFQPLWWIVGCSSRVEGKCPMNAGVAYERKGDAIAAWNTRTASRPAIPRGEEQIKHMVNRFLGWRLPKPWNPDNGISYTRPNYAHAPADHDWPTGTNLFDATQVDAMVRYMLDGIPLAAAQSAVQDDAHGATSAPAEPVGYMAKRDLARLKKHALSTIYATNTGDDVPLYSAPPTDRDRVESEYRAVTLGDAKVAHDRFSQPISESAWEAMLGALQSIGAVVPSRAPGSTDAVNSSGGNK